MLEACTAERRCVEPHSIRFGPAGQAEDLGDLLQHLFASRSVQYRCASQANLPRGRHVNLVRIFGELSAATCNNNMRWVFCIVKPGRLEICHKPSPSQAAKPHPFDYALRCAELPSVETISAANYNSLMRAVDATDSANRPRDFAEVGRLLSLDGSLRHRINRHVSFPARQLLDGARSLSDEGPLFNEYHAPGNK
ncbi:MAG: hypothetical protein DWQ42_08440, partial [Planctomycetota bacterium]